MFVSVLGAFGTGLACAADWQFRAVSDCGLPVAGATYGRTWADLDADGNWDLVLSRHADRVVEFYFGHGDLRFSGPEPAALPPGLLDHHGTAACDYDADGDWDLFLSVGADRGHGLACKQLWRNDGGLEFTADVDCDDLIADRAGRGRGALWLSLDTSSSPQLLLLNYQSPPRLFGRDAQGSWQDLGERLATSAGTWWTVAVTDDFDGDGAPDLFAAGERRWVLHNQEGRLVPVAVATLPADGPAVSAAASGDVDGDGDPDLVLGLRFGGLWLLRNDSGPGAIRFAAPRIYPDLPRVMEPVSVVLADLDNDGRLDLAVAQRGRGGTACAPLLARGLGDGAFTAVSPADAGLETSSSRAMCLWALDLDRDGDLDLVTVNGEGPARRDAVLLYENLADTPGVTVELVARPGAAPHGLGARVTLRDARGERQRTVRCVANPWNATTLPVHCGLGDAEGDVQLAVIWPDGCVATRSWPRTGGSWRVVQGR